jgi:hypothetical protein
MYVHDRNTSTNRYPLFKELFVDIDKPSVLDYGGNQGNLLYFSKGDILECNYTSIDVSINSVELGKKEFPLASWYHYDCFNHMYNHNGTATEFPNVLNTTQDLIWAYSVFSHTDLDELVSTLTWLTSFKFKKLAVSVLDINTYELLQYFYMKRVNDFGKSFQLTDLQNKNYDIAYFYDNDSILINNSTSPKTKCKYFISLFDLNFLQSYLKEKGFNVMIKRPGNGYIPFLCIEN